VHVYKNRKRGRERCSNSDVMKKQNMKTKININNNEKTFCQKNKIIKALHINILLLFEQKP
jgi:hypothetical protein